VNESSRSLPAPAIDACELERVMGVDAADAQRAVVLATLAVEAAIWPNELPDPPLPAPLQAVLLTIATRIAGSTVPGSSQVVSESIGAYSYRLAGPPSLDDALALSELERRALAPWMPAGKRSAYQLDTSYPMPAFPIDWWQRDYDNLVALADAQAVA